MQVTKKFTEHAEIESKGKTITRNGDEENPAYKVERPGKNPVLKKVCQRERCLEHYAGSFGVP